MRIGLLVLVVCLTACSESPSSFPTDRLESLGIVTPDTTGAKSPSEIIIGASLDRNDLYQQLQANEYDIGIDTLAAIVLTRQLADSIRLQAHFNLGRLQYWHGYWDASINNLTSVIENYSRLYGETHPNVAYAKAFVQKGYGRRNRCDEAEKVAFEALDVLKKHPHLYNPIIQSEIYLGVGYYYKCRENLPQMRTYCQMAFDAVKDYHHPRSVPKRGWALIELANAGLMRQDYWEAIDYFNLARMAFDGYPDDRSHPDNGISTIHNDLGFYYNQVGLFDESINYLSQAVKRNFHDNSVADSHPGTAANFKNIAFAFAATGDLDRAKIQYETALEILALFQLDAVERTSLIKMGLIELLYKQGRWEEAEQLTLATLKVEVEQNRQNNIRTTAPLYQWLGKIYLANGDEAKAEQAFSQAAVIFGKPSLGTKQHLYTHNLEVSAAYIEAGAYEEALARLLPLYQQVQESNFHKKAELTLNVGKCYLALGDQEKAKMWLESTDQYSGYRLRDPDRLKNRYDVGFFSDFLTAKSKLYKLQYQNGQDRNYLDSAVVFLEDAANYLYEQRPNLYNFNFISEVFKPIQEQLLLLYEEQGSPDMELKLFRQFEQSKAVKLLQSAKKRRVKDFPGLPSSIPHRVKELVSKMDFYETRLLMDPDATSVYAPKLETAIQQLDRLKDSIEQQYPRYYDYRFRHQTIAIGEVQQQLDPGEAVLSYFWGVDFVKAILITPDEVEFKSIGSTASLKKEISLMLEGIEQSRKSNSRSNRYMKQYADYATHLYQTLLSPFNALLQNGTDRLLVIGDGPISSVPFDALLMEIPEDLRRPHDFNYLVKRFSFSIAHSATFQFSALEKTDEPSIAYPYVGFAPFPTVSGATSRNVTTRERMEVGGLPHSKLEVELANDIFKGKYFLGPVADRTNFLKFAPQADILHCATHAVSDTKNGSLSYLLFSVNARTDTSEQLYARELYNLDLHAQLAILSACQSAKGSYQFGEGVESIAYAFSAAGARSVCATYWNLNDEASYELLKLFFKALERGEAKDKALQSARLKFIEANRSKSHPYYWSVLHLYGDRDPLSGI